MIKSAYISGIGTLNTLVLFKKLHWFLFVYDLGESPGEANNVVESLRVKLKRDVIFIVLLSYILFIFSPVMPYLADAMAHTFWEKEHLAAEHAIYGKDHVVLEIAKAAKQSDKASSSIKQGAEESQHVISCILFNFSNNYHFVKQFYQPYRFDSPISYSQSDFRPPRA